VGLADGEMDGEPSSLGTGVNTGSVGNGALSSIPLSPIEGPNIAWSVCWSWAVYAASPSWGSTTKSASNATGRASRGRRRGNRPSMTTAPTAKSRTASTVISMTRIVPTTSGSAKVAAIERIGRVSRSTASARRAKATGTMNGSARRRRPMATWPSPGTSAESSPAPYRTRPGNVRGATLEDDAAGVLPWEGVGDGAGPKSAGSVSSVWVMGRGAS
jgi:hypothetical protein